MAWYDQLITDIKAGIAAVAADVKTITPRLLPTGGTDGQVLTRDGTTATKWATPAASGGNVSIPLTYPDSINGVLQGTDRLIDLTTSGGMQQKQGYFHQIVAERAHVVGGITFNVFRTGSIYNPVAFSNAVAIFDKTGAVLAKAEAGSLYMGSTGWKKAYFASSITLVAGERYVIGILATGDGVPGFVAAGGNGHYNMSTPAALPRCFLKTNVTTFNSAVTFDTSVTANNDARVFLGMIPPA
ncbi:hypothetical protein GCM10028818_01030 [Spirosoma horti]